MGRLKRNGQLEAYNSIIQEQLQEGIVEKADLTVVGREFYLPHKPVIRENAAITKMRIVYDASTRVKPTAPPLNECLNVGPPLQNQLWKVIVRGRFHAVAIAGDIKKAFLQVRVRKEDRDAPRFHWVNMENPKKILVLRFTRVLFGLGPSPFLLGGVIQRHLNAHREGHPMCVSEIENGLYVDDLLSGGQSVSEAREMKEKASNLFRSAHFVLHKWKSNARELELDHEVSDQSLTYAKQELGMKPGDCGLHVLGLKWDKDCDTIAVEFPVELSVPTKRGILSKVPKIYDPFGFFSPVTLPGKQLYREACDAQCAWDEKLPEELAVRYQKWEQNLPRLLDVPRALVIAREQIEGISLHAFGDASGRGVAAVVYAVVKQGSCITQGLVAARSRLAKQGLTIPRLELVSGHMAVNLIKNVSDALVSLPVTSMTAWLDSSVALHWILKGGDFKQFVGDQRT